MQQATATATSEQIVGGVRSTLLTDQAGSSGGGASTMKQATGGGGVGAFPLMYMYSGHDSTISPLLAALGQPESHWPPFTANLVYELWQRGPVDGNRQQQQGDEGSVGQWGAGGGGDEGEGKEQQEMRRRQRQAGRLRRRLGMAPQGGGSGRRTSSGGGKGGGRDSAAAPAFDVRVLYNQQVMDLQYSRKGRRRMHPRCSAMLPTPFSIREPCMCVWQPLGRLYVSR